MQTERVTPTSTRPTSAGSEKQGRLASFNLVAHLAESSKAQNLARHLKIGVENWLTTQMMMTACRTQPQVPEYYKPRASQYDQIQKELHSYCSKDKYTMVLCTMPLLGKLMDDGGIDWVSEMERFPKLEMPNYYLQPFHSIPGGWLKPLSAIGNVAAFRALYRRAHRRGAEGLREDIAAFVPKDAKVIYDFGASTGGQSAAIAERVGRDATIYAVEPSPAGIIHGKKHIHDPRIQWVHDFVENIDFQENSADAVNLMFVAHECPDNIKRELLKAAFRVLKPGGVLVWTDPPADDLCIASRGFFEPYAWQWQQWGPDRELKEVGFRDIRTHHVVDPQYMWTRVATK
jgi:SAM-dependent methyltransferase